MYKLIGEKIANPAGKKIKVKFADLPEAAAKALKDFAPTAEQAAKVIDKKYNPSGDVLEMVHKVQPNTVKLSSIVDGTYFKK